MLLLDTDMLIHVQRGEPRIAKRFRSAAAEDLAITVVTRIEFLRARFDNVLKAANAAELESAQHRLNEADRFLSQWTVVDFDVAAREEFTRLVRIKGLKKIGRADVLIASIALAQKAVLVTRNSRDFERVPGLPIENWFDET
jgi:tRNA(fMet)-specific endonuclease VapC